MVKVVKGGKEYYLDGYLKANLDICIQQSRKNWDFVIVVDGTEGGGKSVMVAQVAKYVDPSFCLSRCAFNPEQFQRYIEEAKQYQAVVLDEGYGSLGSRAAMSKINRAIVKMLTEIRRKNLFIFIVLPSFFDLDRYVTLWRSRALINVYHDRFERGFFKFYGESRKKKLYVLGKKLYDYHAVRPDFIGRFVNKWMYEEDEYDIKKESSTKDQQETTERDKIKDAVCNLVAHPKGKEFSKVDLAKVFSVTRQTIYNYIKE